LAAPQRLARRARVLRRRPAGRRPPAALVDQRRGADDPRALRRRRARLTGRRGPLPSAAMPVRVALRAVAIAAFALALLGGLAAAALAQTAGSSTGASGPTTPARTTATTQTDPNAAVPVPRMDKRPAGYRRTGFQVQKIAERTPVYRKEHAKFRGSFPNVYTKGPGRWQVSLFSAGGKPEEIASLYVGDATGTVT